MSAFARAVMSLLIVVPSLAAAATTPTAGEVAAMACSGCHGQSTNQIPDLSRYNAEQITAMMLDFRSGERSATLMSRLAKGYSEVEIRAIAEALGKM